ncbi:MAG: rhodanese-like domain-containing protein [Bacilli bacterium]
MTEKNRVITGAQLEQELKTRPQDLLILDVRDKAELNNEFAEANNFLNIPLAAVPASLDMLEPFRNRETVIVCQSGRRAKKAQAILDKAGFTNTEVLKNGVMGWRR